jgi:hypothetical protein
MRSLVHPAAIRHGRSHTRFKWVRCRSTTKRGPRHRRAAPSLRWPMDLAGVPAICLPCGFSPDGLPYSIQFTVIIRTCDRSVRRAVLGNANADSATDVPLDNTTS